MVFPLSLRTARTMCGLTSMPPFAIAQYARAIASGVVEMP